MTVGRAVKTPSDSLDYIIDWSAWLESDTISTSTFVVPPGLTAAAAATNTTTTSTAWISGGEVGQVYTVQCTIVTANATPRTKVVTFQLQIEAP